MGDVHFLTADAITWARGKFSELPKDQAALFWCLILSKVSRVDYDASQRNPFVLEFEKYFGAPILGGGVGAFSPMDGKWRAENYLQSTVFGRLLNGSHWWTSADRGFLKRSVKDGWPADFIFDKVGADRLFLRKSAPSTSHVERLPIAAVALYYYRFQPLKVSEVTNLTDLVEKYKSDVTDLNADLHDLFDWEIPVYWGSLFREDELTELEQISCFPKSPFSAEGKQNVLLYSEDVKKAQERLSEGQTIADLFRKLMDS